MISYVGYQSVEIRVTKNATLNIVMEQQKSNVDEIVVVGYASQRKANLTGATDKVGAKDFESRPINNIGSGLQGLVANLNITNGDGRPNTASALNIRGAVSINGGEPLILVDNIPVTQAELTYLNPTDVESVTVLKLQPEMANRLLARKVHRIRQADTDFVAAGNIGCLLQIQHGLQQAGLRTRAIHPVELVDWSLHGQPQRRADD